MRGRQVCMSANDYFAPAHLARVRKKCATQPHDRPAGAHCGMTQPSVEGL